MWFPMDPSKFKTIGEKGKEQLGLHVEQIGKISQF